MGWHPGAKLRYRLVLAFNRALTYNLYIQDIKTIPKIMQIKTALDRINNQGIPCDEATIREWIAINTGVAPEDVSSVTQAQLDAMAAELQEQTEASPVGALQAADDNQSGLARPGHTGANAIAQFSADAAATGLDAGGAAANAFLTSFAHSFTTAMDSNGVRLTTALTQGLDATTELPVGKSRTATQAEQAKNSLEQFLG